MIWIARTHSSLTSMWVVSMRCSSLYSSSVRLFLGDRCLCLDGCLLCLRREESRVRHPVGRQHLYVPAYDLHHPAHLLLSGCLDGAAQRPEVQPSGDPPFAHKMHLPCVSSLGSRLA